MFSECMYTYVIHIETYDIQSYIDIYVNVYTYMNLGQCSFRLLTCFFSCRFRPFHNSKIFQRCDLGAAMELIEDKKGTQWCCKSLPFRVAKGCFLLQRCQSSDDLWFSILECS